MKPWMGFYIVARQWQTHFCRVARWKPKQNTAVTSKNNGLNFHVCITHPTLSWMRAELSLEHMKTSQGSSLHRMDDHRMHSNAMLLMNLLHIVKTYSGQLLHASGSVVLVVASNFYRFVALLYSNRHLVKGIYVVQKPEDICCDNQAFLKHNFYSFTNY